MLSAFFVYALFLWGCFEGLRRPWVGLVIFYGFVFLEPTWNWRWAIDPEFPFQKYISACILTGLLFAGLRGQKIRGVPLVSFACLFGFLALAYISSFQSIAPETSERYLSVLWKVIFFAFLTTWLIDTPNKLWILLWVAVVAQGYNAYQLNLYYFQDGFCRFVYGTNWGTKGDSNVYSIYTIPVMAMSGALAVYGRTVKQQFVALSIFVLQMHALMLLESRGTMLAGLFMAALLVLLVKKTAKIWGVILAASFCGFLLAGPSVVEEFQSAFKSEDELDTSAASRKQLWKAGAIITAEYPMLGVGPNAGRFLVPDYLPPELHRQNKALHNLFFEISTGCGVPAAVLYVGFYVVVWIPCLMTFLCRRRGLPDWAAASCLAVSCGVPAYWLGSMFSSGALLESSYVLIATGASTMLMLRRLRLGEVLEPESGAEAGRLVTSPAAPGEYYMQVAAPPPTHA